MRYAQIKNMDMSKEDASNFVDFDKVEYAKLFSIGLTNFPDLIQPLPVVGYFCCCTSTTNYTTNISCQHQS